MQSGQKWIKPCESAHCLELAECDSGACLELAELDGEPRHLIMRATELEKNGPHILVTREELAAFLTAAKAGQYDHLVQGV
jgi:hypothetical protein